jgi:phosphohistidine phosphatase SixA
MSLTLLFINCKKETITKIQTVVQKDTVYVNVTIRDTVSIPALISDTTTTCIVFRHAEKELVGSDPALNVDGLLRAEELKRILGNVAVDSIYSTPFVRTRQTVQPLATDKGLKVIEYATTKPYEQFVKEVLAANRGKVVVIVGYSNTVPDILKVLSNNSFAVTIEDNQFDNLFIVSRPDKLKPSVLRLKYGKNTP